MAIIEKIKEFLFRIIKFKEFLIFIFLDKKLRVKNVLRKFVFLFKHIEIGDKNFPWITIKAKLWLDKILRPDMILYEFGSGMSTLYFSTKVKTIISIEHDKNWYSKIKDKLKNNQIDNCEYYLKEPEYVNTQYSKKIKAKYISNLTKYQGFHFRDYIESINRYSDQFFDLVFIDGRARIGCILHSIKKIKPGGYLVLDNSDEKKYKLVHKILKSYEKRNFFGIALSNPYFKHSKISFWNTTVWKIK
jgi:precorrin-6B methylase 2